MPDQRSSLSSSSASGGSAAVSGGTQQSLPKRKKRGPAKAARPPPVNFSGGYPPQSTKPDNEPDTRAWLKRGGLTAIVEELPDRRILPSGGANSGISRSMLLAGSGDKQRDVGQAIVNNSNDPQAWTKLGHLVFKDANDGDLAEWMIGHAIGVLFHRRFWPGSRSKDRLGICYDTLVHKTGPIPPEVKILVDVANTKHKDASLLDTEVLISRDPTVDGSKEIHRNCLRDAMIDTYGPEIQDMTFEQIRQCAEQYAEQASNITQWLEAQAEQDEAAESSSDDDEEGPAPEPLPKPAKARGKKKASTDAAPAKKSGRPPRWALTANITTARHLLTKTQEYFGHESDAVRSMRERERRAQMTQHDRGTSFAAFYATATLCTMAQSYAYTSTILPPEPKNQRQARMRPDAFMWQKAEQKELDTLWKMGAFEFEDEQEGREYDPLPLQFVYKLKVKDGNFDNCIYKARLVIMGHLQYDDEYGDTYAPTARLWVVRAMAAIAAQEGLTMKKFDLTGAFLVADMDRELYVQIPGYNQPRGKVLRLKKALYGGKSSGALFAKEISTWLKSKGFEPCSVDETLFRLTRTKGEKISTLIISLYVDDGACCTNDEELYQEFLNDLRAKYDLSDNGILDWHLGMKVTQNLEDGTISLDQTAYIDNVLKRFEMEDATERYTPLPPKVRLSKADSPKVKDNKLVKYYQQLIGSLMYISCGTRPDIAYAVNACTQFMSNPGEQHKEAAKHILRYLKATKHRKLTYSKQKPAMANKLYGYVDADHAGSRDDRKSVGGYVLMLNGAAISWSSRKIKVISLSSFESEWYSASICGCEVVVVRRLLEEIGRKQSSPTVLFEDNAACIHAATNSNMTMNPRSKHIDTRVFKLREFVDEGILKLVKVGSASNVADCLTKPLGRESVEMARDYMLGDSEV